MLLGGTRLQARSLKNESQIIKPLFEIPGLGAILYSLSEIDGRAEIHVRNFLEKSHVCVRVRVRDLEVFHVRVRVCDSKFCDVRVGVL